MRRVVSALAVLALVMVTPTGVLAQDLAAMCENFATPADGHWAEYSAQADGRDAVILFAILSAGDADGKVLELTLSEVGGQSMIMQVSVPSYPFETSDITRVVMKAPGQPAMVLPAHLAQMSEMTLPVPSDEDCLQAEFLGMEDVEVAGTTYETFHIRPADQANTEVWVTTEIPFAIVRAEADQGVMQLLEHGVGAVSSINETPITIPGM